MWAGGVVEWEQRAVMQPRSGQRKHFGLVFEHFGEGAARWPRASKAAAGSSEAFVEAKCQRQ